MQLLYCNVPKIKSVRYLCNLNKTISVKCTHVAFVFLSYFFFCLFFVLKHSTLRLHVRSKFLLYFLLNYIYLVIKHFIMIVKEKYFSKYVMVICSQDMSLLLLLNLAFRMFYLKVKLCYLFIIRVFKLGESAIFKAMCKVI